MIQTIIALRARLGRRLLGRAVDGLGNRLMAVRRWTSEKKWPYQAKRRMAVVIYCALIAATDRLPSVPQPVRLSVLNAHLLSVSAPARSGRRRGAVILALAAFGGTRRATLTI
jgi:hypothetical protein